VDKKNKRTRMNESSLNSYLKQEGSWSFDFDRSFGQYIKTN